MSDIRSGIRAILDRMKAQCERWSVVGDYRRGERNVLRLEFVIVPKTGKGADPDDFFAQKTVDYVDEEVDKLIREKLLERSKDGNLFFAETKIRLILHKCKPYAFASMQIKHTGPRNYLIEVATTARAFGLTWIAEAGLRNSKGEFLHPEDETSFLKVLRLPYVEPEARKWGTIYPCGTASTVEPLTKDELRKWAADSHWNFSKCGGELHQFTIRAMAQSDDMFLRVIQQIHTFGYDAEYLGKRYRYLDLDGYFYFTQGYRWNETQLINRKRLQDTEARPEREWKKNSNPFHLLTVKA